MRFIFGLFVFFPSVLLAEPRELVFYNWSDYLTPEVKSAFEAQTNSRVREVYFDSDEDRDEVLASEMSAGFDVTILDGLAAKILGSNNKISPLPASYQQSLQPSFKGVCGRWAVPYAWGSMGILYRTDKISTPPSSWMDILEPEASLSGHIAWVTDYMDSLTPALKMAGYSLNTHDPEALRLAFSTMKASMKHIHSLDYGVSQVQKSPDSSPIFMMLAYNGDQYVLNEGLDEALWEFVVPDEGSSLWVDCLAILSDARSPDLAQAFVAFLQQPEIAAQNTEGLWVATANEKSLTFLDPELLADETVYLNLNSLKGSEFYQHLNGDEITQRNRIMRALKKSHDL